MGIKVYVVIRHDYWKPDGWTLATDTLVLRVFDSKEKADAFVAAQPKIHTVGQWAQEPEIHYNVTEFEVQ